MTAAVVHFVFSRADYDLLRRAIEVAGVRETLGEYGDYVREVERDERGFERDGVVFRRWALSVEAMLRWLHDRGLLPDRKGREKYVFAVHGPSPLRRRYRKGMLLAWGSGDVRSDVEPEASNVNGWYAKLDASRRVAAARRWEEAEAADGRYSPFGDWRSRWAPGS
jgi:hypothetical protein